jgi:hypothetical protein
VKLKHETEKNDEEEEEEKIEEVQCVHKVPSGF